MEALLKFFTQSSAVLIIGYLIYRFVFRKEGYFAFNRIYLLATLILAVMLPLIPLHLGGYLGEYQAISSVQNPIQAINHFLLNEVTINSSQDTSPLPGGLQWNFWFVMVYALGVFVGIIRLVYRIVYLLRLVRINPKTRMAQVTYVQMEDDAPVFSFFRFIFLTRDVMDHPERNQQILTHEQQHVRQLHSFDILLSELVSLVFWFNPFIYLVKKEIRENHELLADDAVLMYCPDQQNYRVLLVAHSTQMKTQLLTHNFSYSLLKRRLFMMKNVRHPVRMLFKMVWVFIALAMMTVACSESSQNQQTSLSDNIEKIDISEATPLPEDSIRLIFGFNMNLRKADFVARLGKAQSCKLDIFNEKNKLIVTLFDTPLGPGDYKATWDISPDVDYFSYVFTAGDNRITGNSYIDPAENYNEETSVYTVVEVMPKFPGGTEALMKYLSASITYPEEAKQEGVQGRVFVSFVVEADGSVSDVNVLRGIGAGCDQEAIRVVSSMPKWTPGKQSGEAVRVAYNLPIKFTLD